MKAQQKTENKLPLSTEQKIKRRNFISFSVFFLLGASAITGWKWLLDAPEETPGITGGARAPLRSALNKTELFFRNFFSNKHLAKTYPKSRAATEVRINNLLGIEDDPDFNPENWKLSVK